MSWNRELASLVCDKLVFTVIKSTDKKNPKKNKRTRKGILAQALEEIKQVLYVMVVACHTVFQVFVTIFSTW